MSETILINKLPTRTWNRLGVNETALLWGEAADLGTEQITAAGQTVRLDISGTGAYSEKVWISEDPSTEWTVENFVTTWDKYIMGDCKCWGSIAAYALDATKNTDATYLCLRHCDGFASFELSHVNNGNLWQSTRDGFKRYHGSWE